MPRSTLDALSGGLLALTMLLVMLAEWTGMRAFALCADAAAAPLALILAVQVRWSRRIFVIVGLALTAVAATSRADWLDLVTHGLGKTAFIAGFFTALASLRNASGSSAAITVSGRFLAQQPPGRRYAALTAGGALFGMLLNYGALVLLGGMAAANAAEEPNPEIRAHRTRRMLLAIQRGFIATLPWSPLAFAVAISTTLIPGARWGDAAGACLVSGAILALTGWALDTAFKPHLSAPAPARAKAEGSWLSLWPLLALLGLLVAGVGGLQLLTGVRTVGVVMLVAPCMALGWIILQNAGARPVATTLARARHYLSVDLPGYRSEIVLLMMAGYIGTLGAGLLGPHIAASGIDLTAVPGWAILIGIVWIIPLAGQLGMNPILSVSLMAPLLPEASALGLRPADLMVAITAGWGLAGASSPYTASTLLIGSLGGVSALKVGLGWNGPYLLVTGAALSLWVLASAALGA
ncbi:MAG: hypothetical protein ACJA1L_001322 [Paracoccaceae bacterium]|jgi:hypothetical protein